MPSEAPKEAMSRLSSLKLFQRKKQPGKNAIPPNLPLSINTLPIEILDLIFSHLDTSTLYLIRSVCQFWKTCIPGHSPILRNAMFLPANSVNANNIPPVEDSIKLHFSVTLDPDFLNPSEYEIPRAYTLRPLDLNDSTHVVNPLLTSRDITHSHLRDWVQTKPFWTSSLVSHPPATTLDVYFDFNSEGIMLAGPWFFSRYVVRRLWSSKGVTVGDLMCAVHDEEWWPRVTVRMGMGAKQLGQVAPEPGSTGVLCEAWGRLRARHEWWGQRWLGRRRGQD
jgi:hypothetical protein